MVWVRSVTVKQGPVLRRGPRYEDVEVEMTHEGEAVEVGGAGAGGQHDGLPLALTDVEPVAGEEERVVSAVPQVRGCSRGVPGGEDHLEVVVDQLTAGDDAGHRQRRRGLGVVALVDEHRIVELGFSSRATLEITAVTGAGWKLEYPAYPCCPGGVGGFGESRLWGEPVEGVEAARPDVQLGDAVGPPRS